MTINGVRRRSSKMERPLSEVGYSQSSCFHPTAATMAYTPLGCAEPSAARILYCLVVQPDPEGPVWVLVKCRLFCATETKLSDYDGVNHWEPDHFTDLLLPLWCLGDLVSIVPHPDSDLKEAGWSVIIPISNNK